jgi:hypothetical protein
MSKSETSCSTNQLFENSEVRLEAKSRIAENNLQITSESQSSLIHYLSEILCRVVTALCQ